MVRKLLRILLATLVCGVIVFITVHSCVSPLPPRSAVVDVDSQGWLAEDDLSLSYDNRDTLSRYDLRLLVRSNGINETTELPVIVKILTPAGIELPQREVIIRLPEKSQNKSDFEITVSCRHSFIFREAGPYIFTFNHSLSQPVRGITAIGINLTDSPI